MSKQKVVILVLSIIGLASTFLPWIKGLFGVTLNEISSISGDKSGIWVVIVCFIIVSLLCLVNKQFVLRGWALFGALLPAIITIAVSIFYLAMDLNSRMIDYFLDIDDASELGLRLGPAPYIVLIAASLIAVFGIALKPKKMIIQILEFEGSLKELYNDFLNKRVHIICPAVNGETTYNEFILRIGGMSTEEANNIVDIANQNNEVITLWPKFSLTTIPLTIYKNRNDFANLKIMEKHINSCFEANREYIKCEKMIFIFEKREDFDNNLAITTLKNWQLKNHLQVYYIPE